MFDVGGTLVRSHDFNGVAEAALSVGIDVDPESLNQAYQEVEEEYDRLWGSMGLPAFWQELLSRASGSVVSLERAVAVIDRASRIPPKHELYSDVLRCLDALQDQGYWLGVVSNGHSEANTRKILEQVGILDRFRTVVTSGTEAVAKPEPEIFLRAVQRIGVPPAESVYVGNLANVDARAATRAGLVGVWLNRAGTGLGDDPPEITSLTELPILVETVLAAPVK